jgi:tetratricopeptide (TPR) repeat protein
MRGLPAEEPPGQISEAQVNQEKRFIEANREKLLGNLDKAITILREMLREDATNAAVAFELGRILFASGDAEDAVKHLKIAIAADPQNEWYPKFLADVYQQQGRNVEGAALYANLVALSPNDQQLYFKQAFFLVRAQKLNEALAVYDALEKRVGINEEIIRRRHTLFIGMGDAKRAAKELERLTVAFPNVLAYQHQLAAFHESQGDDEAARKVYEQIIRTSPNDPKAQLALAGGSNAQADELGYLASLQPSFERADVAVDLKIAKLYPFITQVAETGDVRIADAALALTSTMERVHGGDAKPLAAAGDLYFHSGRLPEAIEKYRATIARDESVFAVWEQLLSALHRTGDMAALYKTANDALDVFPNRATVPYFVAIGADGLKRYPDALDALDMATLMSAKNPQLQADIKALEGQVYQHQGDDTKAAAAFKVARELMPDSPEVNYRYGQYLLARGTIKEAKAAAQKAADADTGHPYYAVGLAQVLYAEGSYDKAENWLTTARKAGAAYWPAALELSGDVLFQLKRTDEAVDFWQQAKTRGGDSPRLTEKITNRKI